VTDVCGMLDADELFEVRYEEFTKNPAESLTNLCRFIGVDAYESYVKACAALADPGGRRSRSRFEWSEAERQEVEDIIASRPLLQGYTFDT
jgi:hypothetical protein